MYSPVWLETTQVAIALVLLGLALPSLLAAYQSCAEHWRGSDRSTRALLLAAIAISVVLRWMVFPRWMAMVFIGYLQTARSIELLPLGQYGAGSAAFYHALFAVLPRDHAYLMAANSVIGVLTLPLAASVASRIFDDRRVGAVTAMAIAMTPLFIRNDNSEANNVPALWWLFGGLWLFLEHRADGRRNDAVMATCLLTLAAISRPEMPFLVVGLLVILPRALAPTTRPRDRSLIVVYCVAALLVVPHLLHVRNAARTVGAASVAEYAMRFVFTIVVRNVVIDPRFFPLALFGLAIWSSTRDRRSRIVLAAALLAFAVYVVDLDRGNMARAEVPAAMLVTMVASAAVVAWVESKRMWVAIAASAAVNVPFIFARTNEQTEDESIRAAIATLPYEPKTFVRHAFADLNHEGEEGFTQQHFPDYFLDTRAGPTRLSGIDEFRKSPDFSVPVFFYWGVRCYGRFRGEGLAAPHGEQVQPACAAMRDEFRLIPVLERTVPNRGDVWLEYYSDQATLRIGLYRVRPKS